MVKVKLNDLNFRYDVYQIINLFFNFADIKFVEEDYDFNIAIEDDRILISNSENTEKNTKKFTINPGFKKKEEIRKSIFIYFSEITKKSLPWGTLVGIRPSKKALELLEQGKNDEEIIEFFKEGHITRRDKAKLCIEVAKWERNIVNKDKNTISVYIGMPFCPTRCLYCSFTSNPINLCKKLVEPYLEALYYEIDKVSEYIKEKQLNLECVYFGGGTPTAIDDEQFEVTMKRVYEAFIVHNNVKEFTVECGRPDSITFNKLSSMKKYAVHRISINPQTMNDETLKLIGRNHSVEAVKEKFKMARELGFDNINMDMIVGLPGEKLFNVIKTCEEILNLNPDSVTVHGMSIKRASKLHENILNNYKFEIPKQEELNDMYDKTVQLSRDLQMKPYYMYRQKNMVGNMENVGYCKHKKDGIYNIQMIEEKQTIIALGADAVSKVIFLEENRIERFANVKDVIEYTKRVEEMVEKKIKLLNTLY